MTKHNRGKPQILDISPRLKGIDNDINDMKTPSARQQPHNNKVNQKHSRKLKPWGSPRFACKKDQRMYETGEGSHKYTVPVYENFLEKMQILEIVINAQDLYNYRSLGFHKLKKGTRKGQYAVWLTGNWRLIVKIQEDEISKYLLIIEIIDYHH
ncbi:type II toxin-antitoxin system RelE/ParE family toxin [Nodularia sp. UHCC 0506]|uniref:type II toxin-antitoxin system RelE/ParE family toxin n=1 Tax=Nodularia sp. UHCC 0506 TaxID=3110243 RepID=UPI002B1EE82C|nr:type II toxin-antitoxin system RelE/ParE family toxin [Nodularia sp. UHCC 0506]MEA5513326.1 type II toxin-antitoxin system RelE/ParE family toxin [Nodularia sp. UHCC 0506]